MSDVERLDFKSGIDVALTLGVQSQSGALERAEAVMKKKQLATWTPWEREDRSSSARKRGIAQAAAIKVTVVRASGTPGDPEVEVLELDGLRWGFDLTVVPGPEELQ